MNEDRGRGPGLGLLVPAAGVLLTGVGIWAGAGLPLAVGLVLLGISIMVWGGRRASRAMIVFGFLVAVVGALVFFTDRFERSSVRTESPSATEWQQLPQGEPLPTVPPNTPWVPAVPAPEEHKEPPQNCTVHIVQKGEVLYRISLRYGETVSSIAERNGIANPDRIDVGQRLIVCPPANWQGGRG